MAFLAFSKNDMTYISSNVMAQSPNNNCEHFIQNFKMFVTVSKNNFICAHFYQSNGLLTSISTVFLNCYETYSLELQNTPQNSDSAPVNFSN